MEIHQLQFEILKVIKKNSPEGAALLLANRFHVSNEFENIYDLTLKEIEIVKLCGCGLSNKRIAKQLSVTERTIEFHKTNIYLKTEFESSSEIIAYGQFISKKALIKPKTREWRRDGGGKIVNQVDFGYILKK